MRKLVILIIIAGGIWGLYYLTKNRPKLKSIGSPVLMQILSPAFVNNGTIPTQYTCVGDDISPALQFTGISSDAKSLALIVDDTNAPEGDFTHWVVYNIPVTTRYIGDGETPSGVVAKNSAGNTAYTGPCPLSGEHEYQFTLYSLDTTLEQETVHTKARLLEQMGSHQLDVAHLVGRFSKPE